MNRAAFFDVDGTLTEGPTLERRFARTLGRSPKEEILRVRLNRARQLLVETEFPLSLVAEKIGLEHAEYLNVIFKKKTGLTPGQFRAHGKAPQLPSAPGPQPQPIHTP